MSKINEAKNRRETARKRAMNSMTDGAARDAALRLASAQKIFTGVFEEALIASFEAGRSNGLAVIVPSRPSPNVTYALHRLAAIGALGDLLKASYEMGLVAGKNLKEEKDTDATKLSDR